MEKKNENRAESTRRFQYKEEEKEGKEESVRGWCVGVRYRLLNVVRGSIYPPPSPGSLRWREIYSKEYTSNM